MECILKQREDERRSGAVSFSDIAFDQMQKQCVCVVNIMGGGYQNAILHYLRQSHNHHDKMVIVTMTVIIFSVIMITQTVIIIVADHHHHGIDHHCC